MDKRRTFITGERSRRVSRKNKISQICHRFNQIQPPTRGNRLNRRMSPSDCKAFNLLSRLEVHRNNYQKSTMIASSASNSVAFSPTLHLFIFFVASYTFPLYENHKTFHHFLRIPRSNYQLGKQVEPFPEDLTLQCISHVQILSANYR